MGLKHLLVLCFVCMSLADTRSSAEVKCSEPKPTEVKVSLSSRRNSSGNWISQVEVENRVFRNASTESTKSLRWLIDIEHSSVECGDESTLKVLITYTGLPPIALPGYKFFPGIGFYKFHPYGAKWERAREVCAEEGSRLVIINSEEESEVMVELFKEHPKIQETKSNNWAWIGVHEKDIEGEYYTVNGASLNATGFTRWYTGQPSNNQTVSDALVVNRATGALGDSMKSWTVSFICEQEL